MQGQLYDVAEIMEAIYGDGIIALTDAYELALIDRVHDSIMRLFEEARAIDGGALPRGPERWYVEVAPESVDGFIEIASHPWFVFVNEAILGPDWKIVEVGFDIPFPGAKVQPWHRDFASPEATLTGRRINSLAFNLTSVDTTLEMGPFEIAPGTQWDRIDECPQGMFPAAERWARYEERAVKKLAKRGAISARTALTIHRGTSNCSDKARPVLVIGVDGPDATNAAHHDLQMTRAYADALPDVLKGRFSGRVVGEITPVRQKHVIEGLVETNTAVY